MVWLWAHILWGVPFPFTLCPVSLVIFSFCVLVMLPLIALLNSFFPSLGVGDDLEIAFFSFILIVKSLTLNWKVAHGVLYTGECLIDR